MKNRTLAILGAATLALLLLAILDPWRRPVNLPPGRVLDADVFASLESLAMEDPARGSLEIVKGPGNEWRSSDAKGRATDPNAVRKWIAAMSLLRASRRAAPAEQHGFTPESVSIRYRSAEGGSGTITVGALTSDQRHRWIRVDEGRALLVEAHLVGEILEAREHLLSRRVLESRPRSTDALRLSRGPQWVRMEAQGISWTGFTPDTKPAPLDEARSARFRDALGDLEFLAPLPDAGMCEGAPSVVLERGDKRLEMRECGTCPGERIALWTQEATGCVQAELWQDVLLALEEPERLVDLAILPSRHPESGFTLRCGKREMRVDPSSVDERRLQEWWRAIDTAAIRVERRVVPEQCSLTVENQKVIFGHIEETWYARVVDSDLSRAMQPEAASLLRVDATLFASLDLIAEDPLFATRIEVAQGSETFVVERSELLDAWRSTDASRSDAVATEWALVLRQALASLRALRFSPGQRLEGTRARRIAIDFENPVSGLTTHYQLRVVASDAGECLAQVDNRPILVLAETTCERLLAPLPAADAKP